MGQLVVPGAPPSIILSAIDRLIAVNADGGISPLASHIVLFGENAGQNLGDVDYIYVIGANSLNGGLATTASEGSTVYGAKNFSALTNAIPATLDTGPFVVMGYNIAPVSVNRMGAAVLIGSNMMTAQDGVNSAAVEGTVIIGNNAVERHTMVAADGGLFRRLVAIGWRVARGKVFSVADSGCTLQSSVIIGAEAAVNCGADGPGNVLGNAVIIGTNAAPAISGNVGDSATLEILIGDSTGTNYRSGSNNVTIGAAVVMGQTAQILNTVIGSQTQAQFANNRGQNTLIGSLISATGLNSLNVLIGSGADGVIGPLSAKQFLLAIADQASGIQEPLMYGDFGNGNLMIGKTAVAGDRNFPGTNVLKLVNGSATGVAPVGGGFFFGVGGELRWMNTAAVEKLITGTFTVGTLPAAAGRAGSRAFVTDALAPAFGAAVAAGGAVFTTVFCNGAAWIVG